MENYIVSARKYRPMTFDTVVGQSSLTVTLKNAIKSGKLAHAYLFCGPRGVGKTTCARIFAKTINCLSPNQNGEACGECESCKAFNEQRSYNIHELDAASNNSVEDIRQLIDQVRIPPQIGKYKVFIIDEVHMLSTAAFNAFLKTLEEPPHHAIFILATTEKHKLLPTILSRCQIYDFNRMSIDDTVAHLANVAAKEGITSEPAALNVIAQKADGGMRDALSIFDQVASFCGGNITYQKTIENLNVLDYDYYFKIVDYCLEGNITANMLTLNEILSKGFEGQHFITGLSSHFRNLLVSRDAQTTRLIESSDEVRAKYSAQAQKCQPKFLMGAMKLCNNCDLNYKNSQNKRLLVELTLIEVAQLAQGEELPGSGRSPKKVLARIFKQPVANGQAVGSPAQVANTPTQATPNAAAYNAAVPAPAASNAAPAVPQSAVSNASAAFTPAGTMQGPSHKPISAFSIRQQIQGTPQKEDASDTPVATPKVAVQPKANAPVSETDIRIGWNTFADSLPHDEIAMKNRLNNLTPTLKDDGLTFEVLADNPTVLDILTSYIPRIETYLHEYLHNDAVHMTVRIREVTDKKKVFSRGEQLSLMLEQSDALRKLRDAFKLEFA